MKRTELKRKTPMVRKPKDPSRSTGLWRGKKTAKGKRTASSLTTEIDRLQSTAVRACQTCFAAGYKWEGTVTRLVCTGDADYNELDETEEVVTKVYKCSTHFDCAHLKSRRHKLIRFSPSNTVCLCNIHHRLFTENPDLWTSFIEEKLPGRWDHLNELLLGGGKVDYEAHLAFWKAENERLKELKG